MMTRAMFRVLLPFACRWAGKQERRILRDGVALSALQLEDARRIGIKDSERVRLLAVDEMPMPLFLPLRRLAESTGLISPNTAGMTLRFGIFIRSDCWGQRRLVAHELAHTAQYEQMGGFRPFLESYLYECLTPPGYPFGPLEQEAKRVEREICAG